MGSKRMRWRPRLLIILFSSGIWNAAPMKNCENDQPVHNVLEICRNCRSTIHHGHDWSLRFCFKSKHSTMLVFFYTYLSKTITKMDCNVGLRLFVAVDLNQAEDSQWQWMNGWHRCSGRSATDHTNWHCYFCWVIRRSYINKIQIATQFLIELPYILFWNILISFAPCIKLTRLVYMDVFHCVWRTYRLKWRKIVFSWMLCPWIITDLQPYMCHQLNQ